MSSLAPPQKTDATQHSAGQLFLVRVGYMGHVGRFRAFEPLELRRMQRIVCRTARGIELGIVLGPARLGPTSDQPAGGDATLGLAHAVTTSPPVDVADGRILRRMTAEDELLWGHLQELSTQAAEDCNRWLKDQTFHVPLIEVEPLLDGRTLYFHFLSEVDEPVQQHLNQLVEVYEARVRESKFATLLEHGCGPGCGTEKAENGCGSRGGCAVCKIASACSSAGRTKSSSKQD